MPHSMDHIYRAAPAHIHRVRLLLRTGRHQFRDFGGEDLASLLADGVVILGEAQDDPWGAAIVQREDRSAVLPTDAPGRAMLRGIALAAGRSPSSDLPLLIDAAVSELAAAAPLQLVVYATRSWIVRPLLAAGFQLDDRLLFYELGRLQQRSPQTPLALPGIALRPARPEEIEQLAALDAATFTPTWHLGGQELMALLLAGRVQLAERSGEPIGYTALTFQSDGVAHLARLAVHPAAQGLGVGRLLLHDAVMAAREAMAATLMLNTQGKNERAQNLYRAFGFRATGKVVPVLTLLIP
jgi:ribosomal protein S18 acetylase RimI-like enzyme